MLAFGLLALVAVIGLAVSALDPGPVVNVIVFVAFMALVGWLSERSRSA